MYDSTSSVLLTEPKIGSEFERHRIEAADRNLVVGEHRFRQRVIELQRLAESVGGFGKVPLEELRQRGNAALGLAVGHAQGIPGEHEERAIAAVVQPGQTHRSGDGGAKLIAAQLGLIQVEEVAGVEQVVAEEFEGSTAEAVGTAL